MNTKSGSRSPVEAYRNRLEIEQNVDLLAFLAENPNLEPDELSEICRHDLRACWQRGERRPCEWYFEAIPKLTKNSDQVVDLAYCEYLVHEALSLKIDESSFLARFPQIAETLRSQIQLHRLVEGPTQLLDTKQSSDTSSGITSGFLVDPQFLENPERLGRYQVIRLLGKGGMGRVFLAQDQILNREVAIKIPSCDSTKQPGIMKRLYLEARAVAKLKHPGVCQVYDVGEIDGRHFISMEYVNGQTLAEYLSSQKEMEVDQAVSITLEIAEAIAFAHQQGVLHRDLKPSNVMIDEQGKIRVMDFGLARMSLADESTITQTGDILGTPSYSSPEQLRGEIDRVGPTADVYGLGSLLYFLLVGRPPFVGNVATVIQQVFESAPTPPSSLRPSVPKYLDEICLKSLEKNPSERFSTVEEAFRQALIQRNLPRPSISPQASPNTLVDSANSGEKTAADRRRMQFVFISVAAVSLMVGIIAVMAYAPWSRRQASTNGC